MGALYHVKRAQCHLAWDNSIPPVLHVASGDTVSFDCLDASNGQLTPTSDLAALAALDFARLDQVNGPVHVAGACPGDTLRVEFAGEMGVAPAQRGAFSTIPPYRTGGNIDTRHVTAGATLFLPVEVEGALFSIGDGHAAQGDGGQCVVARACSG